MKTLILSAFCFVTLVGYGQGVVLSSDPAASPDASAIFEIDATPGGVPVGGVLVPRLTEAQKNTLTSTAAEGLWIFQTDEREGYYVFNGTDWTYNGSSSTVSGRINVNTATGIQTGITGTGFTSTQNVSDNGIFDISFTGTPFIAPPSVMVTSEPLPPPVVIDPTIYCQPTHINNCVPFFAADYIDDVIVQSCPGGTCVTPTPTGPISFADINNGCDNTPDNYVNNFATIQATLTGTGPGGQAGSFFNITMQSGPEWRDNLFAFIDWNQDGDFEDAQEVVLERYFSTSEAYDTPYTEALITVPAFAANGTTVLRAMTLFIVGVPAPCGTFSWGETQDYRVDVVGGDPGASNGPRGTLCTVGNVSASGFRVYCTDLQDNRQGTTFHFYATDN